MTPAERGFGERVRARRLDGLWFRRQQPIGGFIADFYCDALRLVVEIDGDVHLSQREYDAERSQVFRRRGLRILRFTNEEVLGAIEVVAASIWALQP